MTDEKPAVLVEESTAYENCTDLKDTVIKQTKNSLSNMVEVSIPDEQNRDWWKKYWADMPEYVNEKKEVYKSLYVHFRNKEDYEEFAKLVDQPITDKTKSIWYPRLIPNKNVLFQWVDDGEEV